MNINYGHNKEILLKYRVLEEYSLFVQCVRKHLAKENIRDIAINNAIDECVNSNILRDFLTKCKAEVIGMLDYEHDVLREWEKLCKGYIEEGYEKRQPEVDALKKETAEAKQETVLAKQEAAEAKQRTDQEKARADKIEAEIFADREKIIRDIAINNAIDECVNNNILRDFLTKCKAEVIGILDYEYDVLREWEKLCKGYIEEGYEKRQPEVDALKKEVDEAEQRTAEAEQRTAEAEQRTAEAEQRANDAEAGQVQIIMNMLSKGKTKEDIIDLTGITEERYIALMKIN